MHSGDTKADKRAPDTRAASTRIEDTTCAAATKSTRAADASAAETEEHKPEQHKPEQQQQTGGDPGIRRRGWLRVPRQPVRTRTAQHFAHWLTASVQRPSNLYFVWSCRSSCADLRAGLSCWSAGWFLYCAAHMTAGATCYACGVTKYARHVPCEREKRAWERSGRIDGRAKQHGREHV